MKKIWIVILLISGCGNDPIQSIQQRRNDAYLEFTVGQAFNKRALCESVDWHIYTDSRDREIVRYQCDMKGASEFLYKNYEEQNIIPLYHRSTFINKELAILMAEHSNDFFLYLHERMVRSFKQAKGPDFDKAAKVQILDAEIATAAEFRDKIKSTRGSAGFYQGIDSNFVKNNGEVFFLYDVVCTKLKTAVDEEPYYTVDKDVKRFCDTAVIEMMSHLINSMSIERTMVLSKNIHQYAHENRGWQAEINLINQSRLNRAIDVDVMVDDLNAWLPSALSEYQKKIDMLEIISTQPSSAYEYVDFIVTEDDRFIIIGSGVQIKNPGEDSFADYPHESPDQPLHIIYADSAVNMTEYMGAVWQ